MAERPVELTGANALTQEEARVLLNGKPWGAATPAELEAWESARRKIAQARNVTKRKSRRLRRRHRRHGGGQAVPRVRDLPMLGGYQLRVAHDPRTMELAYLTVLHPARTPRQLAGVERVPRVSCAADLNQLEGLLEHLEGVREDLAGARNPREAAA